MPDANAALQFWACFEKNSKAFLFIHEMDIDVKDRLLKELRLKLELYCDGLGFEICLDNDDAPELIITAVGDMMYFDDVTYLVDAAPNIDNWIFVEFIYAKEEGTPLFYEDIELFPEEIWFSASKNKKHPGFIDLCLYVRGIESLRDSEHFEDAIVLLLLKTLNELVFAGRIGIIDLTELPDDPEEEGLRNLVGLLEYVELRE
jgi:hypothetical protein